MKILIVSKFFYPRGGADLVAITTRELLMRAGHEVQVFAMEYPENIPLLESNTWPKEIKFNGPFGMKVKAFGRLMGFGDVRTSYRRVLKDFRPDVVHFHNIHSYLSPAVVTMARRFGARTVWTLHDFKIICPAYILRRPDGTICTDCVDGKCNILKYNCQKGSRLESVMARLESMRWNRSKLDRATDCFIAPSHFMKEMMVRGGFNPAKIVVLPNFIDPSKLRALEEAKRRPGPQEKYFCYVGRLSREKGLPTLIQAAVRSGVRLVVGGDGPLRNELQTMAHGSAIEFLGRIDREEVAALLSRAAASVIPSEWYENNPLSVIESLCAGTPVIGADMGGIPELITPGVNGEHFPAGSVNTLAAKLATFDPARYDREAIAARAFQEFSPEAHLRQLLKIYRNDL